MALIVYFEGLTTGSRDLLDLARCQPPADVDTLIDGHQSYLEAHGPVRLKLSSVPATADLGTVPFEVTVGGAVVTMTAKIAPEANGARCIVSIDPGDSGIPVW